MATTLGLWTSAFFIAVAVDFAYCRWVIHVGKRNKLVACLWSAACPLLGFFSFVVCFDSYSYSAIVPTCVGSAVGTWLSMRENGRNR